MDEQVFSLEEQMAVLVFGSNEMYLHRMEERLGVHCRVWGPSVTITGPADAVQKCMQILKRLHQLASKGDIPQETDVLLLMTEIDTQSNTRPLRPVLISTNTRKAIVPRTPQQHRFVEAMQAYPLVFGIGPAGTGKSFLSMAMAVSTLLEHRVSRIVLTRPAVEAGEKLGFLPGDLEQKVNPYLRPLTDALHDMVEPTRARAMMADGTIEIAPLAFMRGRTLKNCFIILDEAQNTTCEQMKMFLTRISEGSICVVNGDVTQVDLPVGKTSGLVYALRILDGVEGIAIVHFTTQDVLRHPLVARIVEAWERYESNQEEAL